TSPQAVERLPVPNPKGIPIQLSQVANISVIDGQTLIARDSGRRRLTVRSDIVGRDQGGFVAEAQRTFDKELKSSVPEDVRVRWISELRLKGMGIEEAIIEGALNRLRPILMASMVAILGLLPASIATGLGSDVQRPMATVIVWGLFSSTILTLFVVPVLYRIVSPGLPKPEEAEVAPPLEPEAAQHLM